jgi:hypothetical protein
MAAGEGIEHAPEHPPFDRRTLRSELVVVLAVTFLAAAANAILGWAQMIAADDLRRDVTILPYPPMFAPWLFVAYMLRWIVHLAPVALVGHLLRRTGAGLRSIGLDLADLGRDVVRGTALAVPFIGLSITFAWAIHTYDLPFAHVRLTFAEAHRSIIVPMVLASAGTAILEETIVNGYTLTRLEQLGWSARRALAVSALIRASYHLYQGVGGFLFAGVAGLVFGRLFQRWQRIMPLVVAHFVIDAALGAMDLSLGGRYPWL